MEQEHAQSHQHLPVEWVWSIKHRYAEQKIHDLYSYSNPFFTLSLPIQISHECQSFNKSVTVTVLQ